MLSAGEPRTSLLAEMSDQDDRYPNTVFSRRVADRRTMDYISVQVHADWPKVGGRPVRFSEIRNKSERVSVFNLISAIKDFLERCLMADLELVEVRTGCIKITFLICSPITVDDVSRAMSQLKDNEDRYRVIGVDARVGMQRLI